MTITQTTNSILTLQKAYEFRRDSEVGYMLGDHDIISAIRETCKMEITYDEAEAFFNKKYPEIRKAS